MYILVKSHIMQFTERSVCDPDKLPHRSIIDKTRGNLQKSETESKTWKFYTVHHAYIFGLFSRKNVPLFFNKGR